MSAEIKEAILSALWHRIHDLGESSQLATVKVAFRFGVKDSDVSDLVGELGEAA